MAGKRLSKSVRAGLIFPVTKIRNMLKLETDKRVGERASVYLAAVLQYMTAELIDVAEDMTKQLKRHRINPRAILLGKSLDEELQEVMKGVIIPGGGVIPNALKKPPPASPQRKKSKKNSEKKKPSSKQNNR